MICVDGYDGSNFALLKLRILDLTGEFVDLDDCLFEQYLPEGFQTFRFVGSQSLTLFNDKQQTSC